MTPLNGKGVAKPPAHSKTKMVAYSSRAGESAELGLCLRQSSILPAFRPSLPLFSRVPGIRRACNFSISVVYFIQA
jgi:hypothetical protein